MNTRLTFIGLFLASLLPYSADGAVITWGVVQSTTTSAVNDVARFGDVVLAINGQSQGNASSRRPGDAVLAGITFQSLDFDQFLGQVAINDQTALSLPATTTTGDAQYDTFLNHVAFVNVNNASNSAATGLSGTDQDAVYPIPNLAIGKQYSIQVWYTDERVGNESRAMTYGDNEAGGNSASVPGTGANGLGSFVVGSFTADATSQDLRITTTTAGRGHITGLLVQAVPEPSSLFVCSFGVVGLLVRRRRG
ncbi:MAG: PEP-CTERM sorting domain-containing protein [Rubripirellula sp.]